MDLKQCPRCGQQIDSESNYCINCGKNLKRSRIKFLPVLLILVAFFALIAIFKNIQKNSYHERRDITTKLSRSQILEKELSYLRDYEEISWVEIDDNNVYIGFNKVPPDLSTLLRSIALNGNQSIKFGVHVWGIDANKYKKGWRPGDGSYYEEVTARYGKIE